MILAKPTLYHGERYGKLTVLEPVQTKRELMYRVGCECGNSRMLVRASKLMKGKVKQCPRC